MDLSNSIKMLKTERELILRGIENLSDEQLLKITAPIKCFYTFNQSAHSPLFGEPEKMNGILFNDTKNSRVVLADKKYKPANYSAGVGGGKIIFYN